MSTDSVYKLKEETNPLEIMIFGTSCLLYFDHFPNKITRSLTISCVSVIFSAVYIKQLIIAEAFLVSFDMKARTPIIYMLEVAQYVASYRHKIGA